MPKTGESLDEKSDRELFFNYCLHPWYARLAERRAIWCWNLDEGPSNRMWDLYSSKSVAIKSTVGHLKEALTSSRYARRLIAPVRYGTPRGLLSADANFDPKNKATWPFWLMRPYLLKSPAYRYEREIRFVFGIHPEVAKEKNGVLVEVDGQSLVQDVLVSNVIEKDEARLVYDFFLKLKSGELPTPVYPEDFQKLWKNRLSKFGGTPFTQKDDSPELFPDLTNYQ
jgi:hypothetical protein